MGILYDFEHRVLPGWTYSSVQFFNDLVNVGEKNALYRAAKMIYEKQQIEFPFTVDDFSGLHGRLDADTVFSLLRFPQPTEVPLCYCALIFLDTKTNRTAYYTMERGMDPTDGREIQFLCGWDKEGKHQQYGSVYKEKASLADIFLIRFFYSLFWNLKGIRIPEQPREANERTRKLKCPSCGYEMTVDLSTIKDGESFLALCNHCARMNWFDYRNGEAILNDKTQEEDSGKAEA